MKNKIPIFSPEIEEKINTIALRMALAEIAKKEKVSLDLLVKEYQRQMKAMIGELKKVKSK